MRFTRANIQKLANWFNCRTYIDTNKKFVFLTSNFSLAASTIARLYKCRWQIEIFFKWIKTLPSNQNIFRPNRERGEDSNLDCHQRLCPDRNCQVSRKNSKSSWVWAKSCKFSALSFSNKCRWNKYLWKISRKIIFLGFITNCHYSTYNGTAVGWEKKVDRIFCFC